MSTLDALLLALAAAASAGLVLLLLLRRGPDGASLAELAGARAALDAANEARATLAERCARLESELGGAHDAVAANREEVATLRAALDAERRGAGEKIEMLRGARTELAGQFRALAEEIMTRHGETFSESNRTQVDAVLAPLREKIGEFRERMDAAHVETTRDRATLAEQIRGINETNALLGREARDLTEALRGRSQMQGAWGELVLATILERAGLRAGEEYELQRSFAGAEGGRLRPDVVVNLPGGQRVAVDSKVSLVAYERLCAADTDDNSRVAARAAHLASLRAHIAGLAAKDYAAAIGGVTDDVLMFVPIEGALAAAVAADPGLIGYAIERRVSLVTPTTLMVALRTVRAVWQVDRRNRNADEIAAAAGKLYDKFAGLAADLQAVGERIEQSRTAWSGAMGKLTSGRGNLVRQLEAIRALGARTGKTLPEALLLAADAAPADAAPAEPALAAGE